VSIRAHTYAWKTAWARPQARKDLSKTTTCVHYLTKNIRSCSLLKDNIVSQRPIKLQFKIREQMVHRYPYYITEIFWLQITKNRSNQISFSSLTLNNALIFSKQKQVLRLKTPLQRKDSYCNIRKGTNASTFTTHINQVRHWWNRCINLHSKKSYIIKHWIHTRCSSTSVKTKPKPWLSKKRNRQNVEGTTIRNVTIQTSIITYQALEDMKVLTRKRWSGDKAVSVTVHRRLRAWISFWTAHPSWTL